jgi:hypothetical protein
MHGPNKIDYSKLLGFDMVIDELADGVDFNNPTVGAKLGAKVGTTTEEPPSTKTLQPMAIERPLEPGAPIMRGLGGRQVTST